MFFSRKRYEGLSFTKLRVRVGLAFIIILIIMARPDTPAFFVSGLIISIIGELIRIWSSGHINKSSELTTSGPYAHTRNPLYIGNFLIGVGLCLALTSPPIYRGAGLWFCFIVGFYEIYLMQISREEEVLLRKYPEEFEKYRKAVPYFLPLLKPYSGSVRKKFSFELFKKNHEYRMAGAVLVIYLIFFLRRKF